MKKILSLILVTIMCVCNLSIVVAAEDTEINFPMVENTGIINLVGQNEINTGFEPDVIQDDYIVIQTTDNIPFITSVKLVIKGEKYGRSYISDTEYDFLNYIDANCTVGSSYPGEGDYWRLNLHTHTALNGQLLVNNFSFIYSMKLNVTGYFETDSERIYYEWGNTNLKTADVPAFDIVKNFYNSTEFTDIITELIAGLKSFNYYSKEVKVDYPFLATTDTNWDNIITRQEVVRLSYSEYGDGKGIKGFEGLASQVATFFNKQTNGTITFKITGADANYTNSWATGGIPVVQNSFFNTYSIKNNIIGLFFNYDSTGSLMAPATIGDNGEIVFDISNILKDVNGNTLATIRNIYYGLAGGLNYKDFDSRGIKVEKITLAYKDESAITEEDEEDIETIVEEEPSVTTSNVITTIPETSIETTTTTALETTITTAATTSEITVTTPETTVATTTTSIESTTPIVTEITTSIPATPTETTVTQITEASIIEDYEDENPNTGISLALVPIGISVLGCLLFKKRK